MIEHINVIDCYYAQIEAILDLMMCCGESVDIQSFRTSAEMCVTMLDELKAEIDKIELDWRESQKEQK